MEVAFMIVSDELKDSHSPEYRFNLTVSFSLMKAPPKALDICLVFLS